MTDLAECVEIDAAYVTVRMELAGTALLSLPGGGASPSMSQSGLDVVHNAIEAYGWTDIEIKPPRPSPKAITEMDEALAWLSLIPHDRIMLRKIVGARMLVHPVREKHLFTWRRIGKWLKCDYRGVQRWHAEGIDLIVCRLHARRNFY